MQTERQRQKNRDRHVRLQLNFQYLPSIQCTQTNTFQCILASDGDTSFALFIYDDIQWTTGDASEGESGTGGFPAEVGFNAGDGVRFKEVPTSQTDEVINIETTSNVGKEGLWVFRVDQDDLAIIPCGEDTGLFDGKFQSDKIVYTQTCISD